MEREGEFKRLNLDEMLKKMTETQQPFSKVNFWLIGGCCLLIIIGFLLMSGSGSTIEEGFNPDIFSFRRIVVGPIVTFFGFLLLAFALLVDTDSLRKKWKERTDSKMKKPTIPPPPKPNSTNGVA